MQKYNAIQCSRTETSNDQLFCFVLLICCWNWLTCSHSLLPAISIKIRIFIYTEIRHHLDNNSSMFMNSLWVLLQWEKKYRRLKARKNQMSSTNLHKFENYSTNFLYSFTDLTQKRVVMVIFIVKSSKCSFKLQWNVILFS